ncbi:MAG: leucine-rich repeat domain-containing protein [Bacteroidales bacterium]|nr:leucine-rich repeat domain-containing protein [Bacteroidales bacterium]
MKKSLFTLTLIVLGLSVWAQDYDFSVVAPTGQTLYYKTTNPRSNAVAVVAPNDYSWSGYVMPAGSLTIPAMVTYRGQTFTITTIRSCAFSNCDNLTNVTLPNTVASIEDAAFYHCSRLTYVSIPTSATAIGQFAFCYCVNLTSISLPDSVATIGQYAFKGCNSLTNVSFGKYLSYIGPDAFEECINLIDVTIPSNVASIGAEAFANCINLRHVAFNARQCDDCYVPFNGCSNLSSMTFGDSVERIPASLCMGCPITSVSLPNSVIHIGEKAFSYCSSLTDISIPNSVSYIGEKAFSYCSSLIDISIPNSVAAIERATFSGCISLENITIPNAVTSIGDSAFKDCRSLTKVNIGDSDTAIGSYAFAHCSSLTEITIGRNVNTIEDYAFGYCELVSKITSKKPVAPSIARHTFLDVPSHTPIYICCNALIAGEYLSRWVDFDLFIQRFEFSLLAKSIDDSLGSVTVLQEPTCSNHNAVVQAIPTTGHQFLYWSDGATQNPYTLQVSCDTMLTAYFAQDSTVSITELRQASYEVAAEPGAIVVNGAAGLLVRVFDITGRIRYQGRIDSESWRHEIDLRGLYLVQIGGSPAKKVVL